MKMIMNFFWKPMWAIFKYTFMFLVCIFTALFGIIYFMLGGDEERIRYDSEKNKLVPVFDSKGKAHYVRQGSPAYYQTMGK